MSAWTAVLGNAEARCRISYRLSDPNAAAIEAVADGRGARPHISIGYPCSVFPLRSSRACGSKPAITSKDSTAPAGLPGRFKISVLLRTPHTPRLRAANGVFFPPSARMASSKSSFSLSPFSMHSRVRAFALRISKAATRPLRSDFDISLWQTM